MNKRLLIEVNQIWQAEAISRALQNAGIDFEVVQKAKEYSSIVTGIDSSNVDIMVDETKYIQASEILRSLSSQDVSESPIDENAISRNYFRRVIIFSLIGVIMLPLIFNAFATTNYFQMRKQDVGSGKKLFALLFLILGWILAVVMLLYILAPRPSA